MAFMRRDWLTLRDERWDERVDMVDEWPFVPLATPLVSMPIVPFQLLSSISSNDVHKNQRQESRREDELPANPTRE
jgi:hypothetical protein